MANFLTMGVYVERLEPTGDWVRVGGVGAGGFLLQVLSGEIDVFIGTTQPSINSQPTFELWSRMETALMTFPRAPNYTGYFWIRARRVLKKPATVSVWINTPPIEV
jgi:hypothetical protein